MNVSASYELTQRHHKLLPQSASLKATYPESKALVWFQRWWSHHDSDPFSKKSLNRGPQCATASVCRYGHMLDKLPLEAFVPFFSPVDAHHSFSLMVVQIKIVIVRRRIGKNGFTDILERYAARFSEKTALADAVILDPVSGFNPKFPHFQPMSAL
jgi:hypothetical protein